VLKDSPSLRNYLISIIEDSYQEALVDVRGEYEQNFPDHLPFSKDVDQLLSEKFWQEM
jgi:hypothetical protein